MIEELLNTVAKLAPVITVLVVALFYFLKKEKAYQAQIETLNEQLRTNEREYLELMNKLTQTLDKYIDGDTKNKQEIIQEIKLLEATLAAKIDSLK